MVVFRLVAVQARLALALVITSHSQLVALAVLLATSAFLTITSLDMLSIVEFRLVWLKTNFFLSLDGHPPLILVLLIIVTRAAVASTSAHNPSLKTFAVQLKAFGFFTIATQRNWLRSHCQIIIPCLVWSTRNRVW